MGTAQASDALENLFIDHLFRSAAWAKPTALWVALFTSAPSDAGGGVEVSTGGYARVNLPPGDGNWTATQGGATGVSNGTGGMTSNNVAITFAAPTADWATVGWFALFSASSGGTMPGISASRALTASSSSWVMYRGPPLAVTYRPRT